MLRSIRLINRAWWLLVLPVVMLVMVQPKMVLGFDDLRNLARGEVVPSFTLRGLDGQEIMSGEFAGKVVVLAYLSAEQRSSELAAKDVSELAARLDREDLVVVLATADVVHQAYFEDFRDEMKITAPLGFDLSRELYGELGLIVMPTTIVIDREGRLAHVISIHRSDYAYELEAQTLHSLGELDDAGLAERLAVRSYERGTPKSRAMRHRAAAKLLREKGLAESAELELKKALELDSENNDIPLDLAEIYLELGRLEEADGVIQSALKENAKNRRAQLLHGMYLFQTDELEEAKAVLEEVLILNPDPARTHFYLGMIAEKQGDYAGAAAHYREALLRVLDEPLLREQMRAKRAGREEASG